MSTNEKTNTRNNNDLFMFAYQYVVLECRCDQVFALEKFRISGLTDEQLQYLQQAFDMNGCCYDERTNRFTFTRPGIPASTIMNHLSRKFGFYVKSSTVTHRDGTSYKYQYLLERHGNL